MCVDGIVFNRHSSSVDWSPVLESVLESLSYSFDIFCTVINNVTFVLGDLKVCT